VRASSEFASLSDDINQTVDVLKGYIDSAEKRMEQELEFARVIQESALPKNFKFPRNDFSLWALMDPAKEVGGDFYDFFKIDESHLAMVIADVSGKGVPAALFMVVAKTLIQNRLRTGGDPATVLCDVNDQLCVGNESNMFVTVWLGVLDLKTGHVVEVNAGHEYPAIRKKGGLYELHRTKHSVALGIMEGMRFKKTEFWMEPGDSIFVYTDGVTEATNGASELFGEQRLLDALNISPDAAPEKILPQVREEIDMFVAGAQQFDDITMMNVIYRGWKQDV
jgi:serine phosphatase RsbU (regulator of sigma subunit)